jgi:acetyl-CoA carboxylase biotin carboxylase subunit
MKNMFKRILIANRGEIAIRVMRAAKELNIETVAIFHEADKKSYYLQYADYLMQIYGQTPKAAYLDAEQIIQVAKEIHADAIHPGYGFLSENSDFARKCEDNGIKFIGPKADSIDAMGSKTQARQLMHKANVPIVPGTLSPITDIEEAMNFVQSIGYPVLLKAAAGGGGKGMRIVRSESEFVDNFESAQREAINSFKDGSIYIEKLIENAKHIEIQIIGDEFGNYAYLGERDCSVQRRHQKLIEESPSTVLTPEIRSKMGEVAVNAAKAVNYVNAGTIEFLFDNQNNFYFLEMNTRLQVEHPVTELVTNIDLVKEQIMVASGHKLSFSQDSIKINGHAIECRINAEDVFNDFMPDIGTITYMNEPNGIGIRLDSGITQGSEVSMFFDPMLAKLITYGKDRNEAIEKMRRALKNFIMFGIKSNIPFHLAVLDNPKFIDGSYSTNFITNDFSIDEIKKLTESDLEHLAAIIAYYQSEIKHKINIPIKNTSAKSNWKQTHLLTRKLI